VLRIIIHKIAADLPPAPMKKDPSPLRRERYSLPDFIRQTLGDHSLWAAYTPRPPYQQNDYIGWIIRAKQEVTKQKQLNQILNELKAGRPLYEHEMARSEINELLPDHTLSR